MTNGQKVFVDGALAATGVVLGVLNFKNIVKIFKLAISEFKSLGN